MHLTFQYLTFPGYTFSMHVYKGHPCVQYLASNEFPGVPNIHQTANCHQVTHAAMAVWYSFSLGFIHQQM